MKRRHNSDFKTQLDEAQSDHEYQQSSDDNPFRPLADEKGSLQASENWFSDAEMKYSDTEETLTDDSQEPKLRRRAAKRSSQVNPLEEGPEVEVQKKKSGSCVEGDDIDSEGEDGQINQAHLFWAQRVLSLSFAYMKKKKKPVETESVQIRKARPARRKIQSGGRKRPNKGQDKDKNCPKAESYFDTKQRMSNQDLKKLNKATGTTGTTCTEGYNVEPPSGTVSLGTTESSTLPNKSTKCGI